jgi:hypothetical protein
VDGKRVKNTLLALCCISWLLLGGAALSQDEPRALNPFAKPSQDREDVLPGCIDLSDGTIHPGKVYLTRDVRLKIYDQQLQRQREVPLQVVATIQCEVQKEWLEKEWRFKANADNEKVYTGRSYPVREYIHTITLGDGRTITGPLSGIIYVDPSDGSKSERFLMHKRQKGELKESLESLVYPKKIELGESALRSGLERKARQGIDGKRADEKTASPAIE